MKNNFDSDTSDNSHNKALTEVSFWRKHHSTMLSKKYVNHKPKWFNKCADFLPSSPNTTFLEIGVMPGDVMLFFAKNLKYKCTGIDFSPEIKNLASRYAEEGVEACLVETDFFNWQNEDKFDIVYSRGFIEHFTDYEMVIQKHWEKVMPNGLLILTVPTFITPIQWLIRYLYYEPSFFYTVVSSHNLNIMNLDILKTSVEKSCRNAIILAALHEEGLNLWFKFNSEGIRRGIFRTLLWASLKCLDRLMCKFHLSSKWYSDVAVVIAKKP